MDSLNLPQIVTDAVKEICPIDGIRFPDINDRSTWLIWFRDDATQEKREAAQAVMDRYEVVL